MNQFEQMTEAELKAYIKSHPTDDEAIRVRIQQISFNPKTVAISYGTPPDEIERIINEGIKNREN
ncbi:hypothetical protein [Gloeocapsa sp. PCC 73106]|uniref:DUF6887 family protein n=1 Tax=Gloeocapsa sp. PCC 73106 TaxID=102232 RepID=UPI0002AC50C6|nr:hypothetical protein [Gloeocapsa sp. PCC 73106]ELR97975.1 hypothetical protein GLO73106DRAFT_00017940 [Gloeocapsa sp. PCC 73106]